MSDKILIPRGKTSVSFWRALPTTLFIAVIAFAVFLSAVWTARNEAALVPDYALYAARFAKVLACFTIAFFFRNHIPSVNNLVMVGSGFIVVHLIIYGCMYSSVLPEEAYQLIGLISGSLSGLGEACIILVFAHLFSTFEPKISAVAIAIAYLLNEILYTLTLCMPSEYIIVFRAVGKIIGIVLLAWCLFRKCAVKKEESEYPLQYGMSTKIDSTPPLKFLSNSQEWMLILAGTSLFPFLFGLIAQMCSTVNTNSGLYDIATEAIAIVLLLCLVAFCIKFGVNLKFSLILSIVVPLFATGCLFLPMLWYQGAPYAGLLVKCGYTIFQVLLWVLLVHKAYDDLRHTYLYFGIFYGLFELMTASARLIASNIYNTHILDQQFMSYLALLSLWLIAIYGLIFFAISQRWDQSATSSEKILHSWDGSDESNETDSFTLHVEAFAADYELTSRENDVLLESIHGYSMENIGKKLYISRETVKTHLRHIYVKTGVSGKQELISFIDHYRSPKK